MFCFTSWHYILLCKSVVVPRGGNEYVSAFYMWPYACKAKPWSWDLLFHLRTSNLRRVRILWDHGSVPCRSCFTSSVSLFPIHFSKLAIFTLVLNIVYTNNCIYQNLSFWDLQTFSIKARVTRVGNATDFFFKLCIPKWEISLFGSKRKNKIFFYEFSLYTNDHKCFYLHTSGSVGGLLCAGLQNYF